MADKHHQLRSFGRTSKNIRATLVLPVQKTPRSPVSPSSYSRAILNDPISQPDVSRSPRRISSSIDSAVQSSNNSSNVVPSSNIFYFKADSELNADYPKEFPTDPKFPEPIEATRTNFVQMKEERDQCSKELIEYLSKSLRPPSSVVGTSPTETVVLETPRDASEAIVPPVKSDYPTTQTDTKQIASIPKPPIRNQPRVNIAYTTTNVRSAQSSASSKDPPNHNPHRAKQFMQDQQLRRKVAIKKASQQTHIDLVERKRRLAELHKSSQRIVQKNLQNKRKGRESSVEPPMLSKRTVEDVQEIPVSTRPSEIPKRQNAPSKANAPDRGLITFAGANSRTKAVAPDVASSSRLIEAMKMATQNSKRIGILRRPDGSQASPPSIPTPSETFLPIPHISRQVALPENPEQTSSRPASLQESPPSLSIPNVNLKSATFISNSSSRSHRTANSSDAISSSSSLSKKKRSPTEDAKSSQSSSKAPINVPYWLKPSPLQVYPYNFIMAVRKKLEMIAHPVVLPADAKRSQRKTSSKSMQSTPTGRPIKYFQKKENLNDLKEPEPTSISEQTFPSSNAKTISESLTNLSSISLHVPGSTRSKQPPSGREKTAESDGNTSSISSAIFSQSSPEKAKPASLSTANVDKLKLQQRHPFVNMSRGAESSSFPSLRQTSAGHDTKSRSPSKSTSKPVEPTEMVDMLNSFNQSLSHAIAVNQQLHNALINAPPAASAENRRREVEAGTGEDDEYSSRFDSATTTSRSNLTNRESLLINESSVQPSSLASESVGNTGRGSKTSSSVIVHSSTLSKSNRPSVIVRNQSASSTISSEINALSSNNEPSLHSVHIPTHQSHSQQHPTSSKSSSVVLTQRSSSSSIPTEFSDQVTRGADQEAVLSVRSLSTVNSESNSNRSKTQNGSSSIGTERQPSIDHSNKENVSSSLNTIAKPTTPQKQSSTSSSIISNTIQDSTIEFIAPDGFHTYRNGNHNTITINTTTVEDPNQSIGSDIFAAFSHTDQLEMSTASEANMSYATLGMFDQLLKAENQKSEDLTKLLRIREKALVDRTKGQVAWLELQKRRYQEQGLTAEITTVKKKQRALLVRLDRERAALAKYGKKQQQQHNQPHPTRTTMSATSLKISRVSLHSARSTSRSTQGSVVAPQSAIKAMDMSAVGGDMEGLLQRREQELRQRRQHVEHLIRWHQRLDDEEQAVLDMERQLMTQTKTATGRPTPRSMDTPQRRKQIANIEHSLELLQSMSGKRCIDNKSTTDRISMSGSKLNRLWRRLTGDMAQKFDATQRFVLTKVDIERLYEDAKLMVLGQFDEGGGPMVLDQTMNSTLTHLEKPSGGCQQQIPDEFVVVPSLNLELTSADEELSSITTDAEGGDSGARGYYFSDYAPRSAERSNSEEKSAKALTDGRSGSDYTPDFVTVSAKSVDSISSIPKSDSSVPEAMPSQLVVPNNDDLPNETFINDISCPPFEITTENSGDTTIPSEITNNQLIVSTKTEQVQSISGDSVSLSEVITVCGSSSSIAEGEMPLANNSEKNGVVEEDSLLVEEIDIGQETPSATTTVSESLPEESCKIQGQIEEESEPISSTKTEITDSISDHLHPSEAGQLTNIQPGTSVINAVQFIDAPRDYVGPAATLEKPASKMPDIISEAEVLRRQQIEIEQEIKQLELNAPFVYLREIPNKPPPPYVPPAHGSPMTAIFPSDERIREIVFQRIQQLHESTESGDKAADSSSDHDVTNIYERILLDLCAQCYAELPISSAKTSPNSRPTIDQFRQPLAFYNPPNRLACIQQHILKRVQKLLRNGGGHPSVANGKTSVHTLMHPSSSSSSTIGCLVSSKRKRDVVDEILVQEMLEDDAIWTNFDVERVEVLRSVANDVLRMMVEEAIGDCQQAFEARQSVGRDDGQQ